MVLLRGSGGGVSAERLISSAKELGIPMTALPPDGTKARDGLPPPLSLQCEGEVALHVMLMPIAHPDVPHMPRGVTSPSPEALASSAAHLVVVVQGLEGSDAERDLETAALTACVIDACDAVGAMLAHGRTFHDAALFADMGKLGIEENALPAEIAVDVTAAPEPGDRMSFLTHGLCRHESSHGHREEFYVTCPVPGRGALDFVYGLVRWMITEPTKHLPTGDTVGRTADEKITVQRVSSPTGKGDTVIRLDLP